MWCMTTTSTCCSLEAAPPNPGRLEADTIQRKQMRPQRQFARQIEPPTRYSRQRRRNTGLFERAHLKPRPRRRSLHDQLPRHSHPLRKQRPQALVPPGQIAQRCLQRRAVEQHRMAAAPHPGIRRALTMTTLHMPPAPVRHRNHQRGQQHVLDAAMKQRRHPGRQRPCHLTESVSRRCPDVPATSRPASSLLLDQQQRRLLRTARQCDNLRNHLSHRARAQAAPPSPEQSPAPAARPPARATEPTPTQGRRQHPPRHPVDRKVMDRQPQPPGIAQPRRRATPPAASARRRIEPASASAAPLRSDARRNAVQSSRPPPIDPPQALRRRHRPDRHHLQLPAHRS